MNRNISDSLLRHLMFKKPDAAAEIRGSESYKQLRGTVTFVQSQFGVLVTAQVSGLPEKSDECSSPIFAMHIHSGASCTGTAKMPFSNALGHFNPNNCPHPYHAGDLPPLFSNDGFAWLSVLTERFTVDSVIGRTVIIHSKPDDFTTQPSGKSGDMIACGVIRRV